MRKRRKSGLDVSPIQSMIVIGLAALIFYWVYTQNEKTHRNPSSVEAASTLSTADQPVGTETILRAHESSGAARTHNDFESN